MKVKPVVTLTEYTKQINVLQKRQAKTARLETGISMWTVPYQEWAARPYFEKGADPEDALAYLNRTLSEENDALVNAETTEQ